MHTDVHACTHTERHTYTHAHMYTQADTDTHIATHTHSFQIPLFLINRHTSRMGEYRIQGKDDYSSQETIPNTEVQNACH